MKNLLNKTCKLEHFDCGVWTLCLKQFPCGNGIAQHRTAMAKNSRVCEKIDEFKLIECCMPERTILHTEEEKEYICEECDTEYTTKHYLKQHMLVVHAVCICKMTYGEPITSCDICTEVTH